MSALDVALVVIGGFTLVSAFLTGFTRRYAYLVSEPLAAVILGVVVGPAGLGFFSVGAWGSQTTILEQIARLTLALAVMASALRLRGDYFSRQTAAIATMIGPMMLVEWVVSGLLAYWLLAVPFWVAMLVGAIVTPTDPVLAGSVVSGDVARTYIPDRLRDLLTAESGVNDGSAFPFVFLAILVLVDPLRRALSTWVFQTVLWEVGAAALVGVVVGVATGRAHRWVDRTDLHVETSITTATVALALTMVGLIKLLGGDGILGAFTAGFGYTLVVEQENRTEEEHVQEIIRRLFSFPILVLFGMAIPWRAWAALGWRGVALVAGVLLLRRLPATVLFSRFIGPLHRTADTLFVGWFGPIGIGAVFYATLAVEITGVVHVWDAVSLVVAGSVLVHGVTATPFTKYYGRAVGRADGEDSGSVASGSGGSDSGVTAGDDASVSD